MRGAHPRDRGANGGPVGHLQLFRERGGVGQRHGADAARRTFQRVIDLMPSLGVGAFAGRFEARQHFAALAFEQAQHLFIERAVAAGITVEMIEIDGVSGGVQCGHGWPVGQDNHETAQSKLR